MFGLEFSGAGFSTNMIITHINKPSLCHTRMVPTICEYTKHPSQLSLAHLCGQAQSVLEISLTTAWKKQPQILHNSILDKDCRDIGLVDHYLVNIDCMLA